MPSLHGGGIDVLDGLREERRPLSERYRRQIGLENLPLVVITLRHFCEGGSEI
jgi:hypothetical protein